MTSVREWEAGFPARQSIYLLPCFRGRSIVSTRARRREGGYRTKPNIPENKRSSRCFGLRSYPVNIAYCIIQVLRCTVLYQTGLYNAENIQIIVGDSVCDIWPGFGPASELSAGLGGGDLAWPGPGWGQPVQHPHDLLHTTCCLLGWWMCDLWWFLVVFLVQFLWSVTKSCCWRRSSWNALHIWSKKCCHDVVLKVVAPWFSCGAPCHLDSCLSHHVLLPSAWKKLPSSQGVR